MNLSKCIFSLGSVLLSLTLPLTITGCSKGGPSEGPKFSASQVSALEKAAEVGDPVDKYSLGKKFRDGDAVPQNLTNAVIWFRKSAEAGYAKAQYHLGIAFQDGEGGRKDLVEAVRWYTKAAEQNHAKAQEKLGNMFWKGEGGTKNLVEAHKWLSLAAAGGENKAAKGVKKMELSMTPQQIAEAKKLAAGFIPKKDYKKSDKEK
jgi:uncharacterized protein